MERKPVIALTMGDPNGIGPEIAFKACIDASLKNSSLPVFVGDPELVVRHLKGYDKKYTPREFQRGNRENPRENEWFFIHPKVDCLEDWQPGVATARSGAIAVACIETAVSGALAGDFDAVVTAPINKEAIKLAGVKHAGHTEIIAERCGSTDPLTMFETGTLRVFFLTRHHSLKDAVALVTRERIVACAKSCLKGLEGFGIAKPRLAVAALNPHGGDGGLFGREEIEHISPAVAELKAEGLDVSGPIGADSVFHLAKSGSFDGVLSLYHDQGHIATKTLDFYGTVSVTLGLPFLRTSPDHGTAYDRAWKEGVNPESMKAAAMVAAMRFSRG